MCHFWKNFSQKREQKNSKFDEKWAILPYKIGIRCKICLWFPDWKNFELFFLGIFDRFFFEIPSERGSTSKMTRFCGQNWGGPPYKKKCAKILDAKKWVRKKREKTAIFWPHFLPLNFEQKNAHFWYTKNDAKNGQKWGDFLHPSLREKKRRFLSRILKTKKNKGRERDFAPRSRFSPWVSGCAKKLYYLSTLSLPGFLLRGNRGGDP